MPFRIHSIHSMSFVRPLPFLAAMTFPVLTLAQWTTVSSGTTSVYRCITRAPDGDLYAPASAIRYSANSGTSWSTINFTTNGAGITWPIYDIHFTEPNVGYMAGTVSAENVYRIARTTNGGSAWTVVYEESTGSWPRGFRDLEFINDQVGFAVGRWGRMLKTTNGGANWTTFSSPTTQEIFKLRFLNAQVGLMAASNALWRTTDGGDTWTSVLTGFDIRAVCFGPGNTAFAVRDGAFLSSTDQGLTWTSHPLGMTVPNDLLAMDEQTVLAAGPSGLFRTTDAGDYWEQYTVPILTYHAFTLVPPSTVLVVGENQIILRSTTGGGPGAPVAQISASQSAVCGTTTLNLAGPIAPGLSYTWTVNGEVAGTGQTIAIDYSVTTTVQVQLAVSNGTQTGTQTLNTQVVVTEPITADAGPDLLLCNGSTGGMQGSGSGTYSWSPAAGLSSTTTATPTVTPVIPTTYTLTVTNGPCTATDQVFVDVLPPQFPDLWDTLLVQNVSTNNQGLAFHDAQRGVYLANDMLYHTEDGGATWTSLAVDNLGINLALQRPSYPTSTVSYAAVGYKVLKTTDNWATYTEQTPASEATTLVKDGTHFLNADTGIVWGNGGTSSNILRRLARTLDGGTNWTTILTEGGGNNKINAAIALSHDTIVAVGGGTIIAKVWRTTDGGQTWTTPVLPQATEVPKAITQASDGRLYTASAGILYRSEDRGATWTSSIIDANPLSVNDLEDIHFTHPDTGYAGEAAFKTVNGGACWQRIDVTGPRLMGFSQVADGTLFALARHGTDGMMVLRRNGSDLTVGHAWEEAPTAELHCWPNPAKDHLFVQLPDAPSPQAVQVLDALGRTVPVRSGPSGTAGTVVLDVTALRPGPYLVRISGAQGDALVRWVKH